MPIQIAPKPASVHYQPIKPLLNVNTTTTNTNTNTNSTGSSSSSNSNIHTRKLKISPYNQQHKKLSLSGRFKKSASTGIVVRTSKKWEFNSSTHHNTNGVSNATKGVSNATNKVNGKSQTSKVSEKAQTNKVNEKAHTNKVNNKDSNNNTTNDTIKSCTIVNKPISKINDTTTSKVSAISTSEVTTPTTSTPSPHSNNTSNSNGVPKIDYKPSSTNTTIPKVVDVESNKKTESADVQKIQEKNIQIAPINDVGKKCLKTTSDQTQLVQQNKTDTATATATATANANANANANAPLITTVTENTNKTATKQETKPMNKRLLKKNINAMKTENINLKKELGGLIESLQSLKHQFNVINQQIYQKQLASTNDTTTSHSINNSKTTHQAQDLNRKRSYMDVDDSNVYGHIIPVKNDYNNVFDEPNKENPAFTEQLTDIFLKFEDENDFPLTSDKKPELTEANNHETEQDHESSGNTPNSLFSVYPSTSSSLNTTGMNSATNINSTKHHPTLNVNTTNDAKTNSNVPKSRPHSGNHSPATSHNTHYSASNCSPSSSVSSLFQISNNVSATASVSGGTSFSRSTSMMNVDTSSSATATTNNNNNNNNSHHHHYHSLSSHPQMKFLNDFEEKEFMKKYAHLNQTHHRHSVPQPRLHAKPHVHQLQLQSTTTSLGSSPTTHFQSDNENENENELLIDAQKHVLENIKEEQEFMTAGLSKNLTSLTSFTNLTNLTNFEMMNEEKSLGFYNTKDTGLLAFDTANDDIQMSLEDVLGDVVDLHAHDEDDIDMDFLKF